MNQTPAQGDAPAREGDAPRAPPTPSSTHILASIMPHLCRTTSRMAIKRRLEPPRPRAPRPRHLQSLRRFFVVLVSASMLSAALYTPRAQLDCKSPFQMLHPHRQPSPLLLSNTSTAFGSHCTVLKTSAKLQRQPGQA